MQALFKERYQQYFDLVSRISSPTGLQLLGSKMAGNILGIDFCLDAFFTFSMVSYFTYAYETVANVIAKVDKDAEIIDK